MRKSIVLIATLAILSAAQADARKWVECGTTNPQHATCNVPVQGASCTYTDSTGITRTGSVRICPPCTKPNGESLGLNGTYCFSSQAQPAEVCAGGKVILKDGVLVGCVHRTFGGSERTSCEGLEVIRPARYLGNCWVCIQEELEDLVLTKGSWSQLKVGDGYGNAGEANFSCLGRHRRIEEAEMQGATTAPIRQPDFTPSSCSGTWTPWLNRDNQGGSGDYETLRDHVKAGNACPNPTAIECRTTDDRQPWKQSGNVYHCELDKGGYCVNQEQGGSRCRDFEVRFCCSALP
jgi:hypothetical protein